MKKVFTLIQKDYLIDTRQKYPIAGIVLYIFATIYISYLAFGGSITISTWNALFWIILLFASVTGIARSFMQENNRSLYYYFLAKAEYFFLAKLLYSILYEVLLIIITILLFQVFLPLDVEISYLFYLNLGLGGLGIAASFTLISALSAKTDNQSTMMAILGFPVVIPVLVLAVVNSKKILMGAVLDDISGNTLTLLSVNVVIIAVSMILFPYSWKN
jgi:heme exporter protein B